MKLNYYLPLLALLLLLDQGSTAQNISGSFSGANNDNAPKQKEPIQANFVASDTNIIKGQPVSFTNLSTGNPTFFQWHFEGATPSISYSQSPVIQYSNPGLFDVELVATGLGGADTMIKEDYIQVESLQPGLPPGWEYEPSITQHTIVITFESNPRIFGDPLQPGDYIGVFYEDDNNELKCGGAVEWTGDGNTAVVAQGDNFFTTEKDGFDTGETFNWMLFSWDTEESYPAQAGYDPLLPLDVFVPDAISVVLDLYAGTSIELTIPEGWSGVSSYVSPWENNLEELFESHIDDIEIISNGEDFFRPSQNINTLGNWEDEGYLVKMKNNVVVEFRGYPVETLSLQLDQGWNIIHVPVSCDKEVSTLVENHTANIEIIQEIAGTMVYWPDKNISTLEVLATGQAYFLKASEAFTLQFSPCNQ